VFERFTERARAVLVLAEEEARSLDHGFVGTEHLLLGLIREGDGAAARALESLGISLQVVREKVEDMIGPSGTGSSGKPPFTPRAKQVLELSLREALQLGRNYIGTEHILLGLVREGEGVAAQVLQSLGADLERVQESVTEVLISYRRRDVDDGPGGSLAGVGNNSDLRYPYKMIPGPERSLGSTSLGLRIVGVLLFDDVIRVTWRLHGVPGALTRLVEHATRTSDADVGFRAMRAEVRRTVPDAHDFEPYILLGDDQATGFREIGTTFKALANGEWVGNSDFSPSPPESATTISLAWESDSIELAL
jgi:hypothetical protein